MRTYRFVVKGRVQKVNYRRYVKEIAFVLGYVGYVENLKDGSVVVVTNMDAEEEVEFFVTKLYEGPLFSHVSSVEYEKIDDAIFDDFQKR
ncbi:MAG: acylphosphatase [Sulfurospirillaceae bacterium]|nr:acylphosphatase [Sulfurospirillaceae bacterium]